jgi:carboxypeptidase PM20D1
MKKFWYLLLAIIVVLLITLTVNTFSFASKQIKTESISLVSPIAGFEQRLSEAITHKTISYNSQETDTVAYTGFLKFIEHTYPLLDSLLDKTLINDFSMVYKWEGSDPSLKPILLMGHTDVVPIEKATLDRWEMDPFSGTIKDGFIFGRGTMDDKGNVLAIIEAINLRLKEGFKPKRTIYLSFGHDEEVGGPNGAKFVAQYFKKQGISFEYILDEGGVLMDAGFFPGIDKPAALIGIAEKGYVSLNLKAKIKEAGHSSMPPKETAIGILAGAIKKMEANPFPAHLTEVTSQMFNYLGPEMSFPNKTIFANRWLFESTIVGILEDAPSSNAMVRTTIAPTIIKAGIKDNVLPTEAILTVNFRILPGDSVEAIKKHLTKVIQDDRIEISLASRGFENNPSPISPVNSKAFACLQKSIGEVFPDRLVAPLMLVAGTDCKHFIDLSPNIYRMNPIAMKKSDIPRIHGINERVPVAAYQQAIQFFHQLIGNSAAPL